MSIFERIKTAIATGKRDVEAERLANLAPAMEKVLNRIHGDCQNPQTPMCMNHKIWIEELGL